MIVSEQRSTNHLLSTQQLTKESLNEFFEQVAFYKKFLEKQLTPPSPLRTCNIVNLFLEPSTRTRVSFEVATRKLGHNVINIQGESSSLTKGESLEDTAHNLEALYADALIIRCNQSLENIAQKVSIPVINAGDGTNEHPTQALLDAYTIAEHFQTTSFDGLTVAIIGDVAHSRVAGSNIPLLRKLGAKVILVGPESWTKRGKKEEGVSISDNLHSALQVADVAMFLRIQQERHSIKNSLPLDQYIIHYGLNKDKLSWLKKDAVIMHPGPVNLDIELDAYCANSEHSLILNQVRNGVAVRMAAINNCLKA